VPLLLYNTFLFLYLSGIKIYSLFNPKASKWIEGRKQWRQKIGSALKPGEKRIWIHCSSLGEFEQGRPLIDALREEYPEYKIVLTFFSPSGYEIAKNYDKADYVFYLPLDSRHNAETFINLIDPQLAIFVKYEFWYYYLHKLSKQQVPTILISGAFREKQSFFKWYGSFFRQMLNCFTFFFVQDEQSKSLLGSLGFYKKVMVAGDTRYDRVSAISKNKISIPVVESFKAGNKLLIAGSTWPDDEEILNKCITTLPEDWKLIIAPHEVDDMHIQKIQQLFGSDILLFSELAAGKISAGKILIINNIGILSSLYAYGDIAYVGGGFQKGGIHNILEPAVFGLPVIFGPIYDKFVEAKEFVAKHYAFSVKNAEECSIMLNKFITDEHYRVTIQDSLKKFMVQNIGATTRIMTYIKDEKWLVS